ncbi:MAG: hypothetical protein K0U10_06715, partial [Gammaproteobacteria bacterium]|nr:hypothetical protein [Gammaproteobacteria bacterium]
KRLLDEKGWTPLASQVPVGCADLRLGTMLDLVCLDRSSNLVILEIKCGFAGYWAVHDQGTFRYPFDSVPMSFQNRAQLQLLLSCYLYLHSSARIMRSRPLAGAYIVRAGGPDPTAEMVGLGSWLLDVELLSQALLVLKGTKFENKKARLAKRKVCRRTPRYKRIRRRRRRKGKRPDPSAAGTGAGAGAKGQEK